MKEGVLNETIKPILGNDGKIIERYNQYPSHSVTDKSSNAENRSIILFNFVHLLK